MIYQRVPLKFSFDGPIDQLPAVFVYLYKDGKPFSYFRINDHVDFNGSNSDYKDRELMVERGLNKGAVYHESGLVNMRVVVVRESDWSVLKTSMPQSKATGKLGISWSEEPRLNK